MADGWQIIYFMDEETIEVVPEKWICSKQNVNYSYWPNTRSSSKVATAIKTKEDVKEDWLKFKVKLMSTKVYFNFQLASQKASKATYTDDISTQSESESFDIATKRPVKIPSRYISSSDDEEIDDITAVPDPPKANNHRERSNNSAALTGLADSNDGSEDSMGNSEKATFSSRQKIDAPSTSTGISATSSLQHSEEYKYIIRQLHILNGRLEEQTNLIVALINRQNGNDKETVADVVEVETFEELPIRTSEILKDLENKITDPNVKNALIKKFSNVGGDNLKDLIRRIMPRIIDDEVLKEYSWVGGKGKKKFSLLNLSDVIKGLCKVTPNTKHENEKVIESYLSIYLSKATERVSRREKKRNSVEGHEQEK